MKFKKFIKDRQNAQKVVEFMKGVYTQVSEDGSSKPVDMYVLSEDNVNTDIIVLHGKVISNLEEDRGMRPMVPWEMYTFLNLMKEAGYKKNMSDIRSTVAVFSPSRSYYECACCLTDCKYTGSIVDVPVCVCGDSSYVPVRLCMSCRGKFMKELAKLVDLTEDVQETEPEVKKEEKVTFFGKIRKMFRRSGK